MDNAVACLAATMTSGDNSTRYKLLIVDERLGVRALPIDPSLDMLNLAVHMRGQCHVAYGHIGHQLLPNPIFPVAFHISPLPFVFV